VHILLAPGAMLRSKDGGQVRTKMAPKMLKLNDQVLPGQTGVTGSEPSAQPPVHKGQPFNYTNVSIKY
jgi:hypothetical protein